MRMQIPDNIRREIGATGYPLPRPIARGVIVGPQPFASTVKDNSAAEQSLTSDAAFTNAAALIERFLGGASTNDKNVVAEIHGVRIEGDFADDSGALLKSLRQAAVMKSTVDGVPTTVNVGLALVSVANTIDHASGAGTGQYNTTGVDLNYFYKLPQPLLVDFREAFSFYTYAAVDTAADIAVTIWLDGIFLKRDGSNEIQGGCHSSQLTQSQADESAARKLLHYRAK